MKCVGLMMTPGDRALMTAGGRPCPVSCRMSHSQTHRGRLEPVATRRPRLLTFPRDRRHHADRVRSAHFAHPDDEWKLAHDPARRWL